MDFVEPIRDKKKIAQIKNLLRGQDRYRDLLLFVVGINTALRVSDLLQLRIGDFIDEHGQVVDRFWMREEKRGKRQEVVINESIQEALEQYRVVYPEVEKNLDNFVFFNTRTGEYGKAIKRGWVWKFISTICQEVGLRGNFGTHSLRKTWGYHARMNGVDLTLIMHKLNHNDLSYTKRYLGITDEEMGEVMRRLNL
ncbi:MAG TPA: tyrosine-type recombinase/integrase [Aggregatilineaceae bacterium]|nr:tyrosine-type recombinase/integrase [Aggregatilineaceae bacterium]